MLECAGAYSLSWLRAYPTPLSPQYTLSRGSTCAGRLPLVGIEPGDQEFFDVLLLDRADVCRMNFGGVYVKLGDDHADSGEATVTLSVLVHASGFHVQRLTILPQAAQPALSSALLDRLEAAMWRGHRLPWVYRCTTGETYKAALTIREAMDFVYFLEFDGRGQPPEDLAALGTLVTHRPASLARFEANLSRGSVTAYPVVYGTHIEAMVAPTTSPCLAQSTARALMRCDGAMIDMEGIVWGLGENRSAVVLSAPETERPASVHALSADRMQMLEYLTFQRGVLRAIQRSTHDAVLSRRRVTRADVARWQRLTTAATDPYALHDRVGPLLEEVRVQLRQTTALRDPGELASRVERNIGTFSSAISATIDRTALVISILFGIVATTSLSGVVVLLFRAFGQGGGLQAGLEFEDAYPGVVLLVNLGVGIVFAVLGVILFRRTDSR